MTTFTNILLVLGFVVATVALLRNKLRNITAWAIWLIGLALALPIVRALLAVLIVVALATPTSAQVFGKPLVLAGGGYSRPTGLEAGAETWLPIRPHDGGALIVIAGVSYAADGPASPAAKVTVGGGFYADGFSFDGRGFWLTGSSHTGGGGSVGAGFALARHLRIRGAVDWGTVDGKQRTGVSVLLQLGPFGG